ncbi:Rpi1p Ecym_1504 [Eremothecium cymbalariae DBVPG|uniref:Myb-like domain-containing protein n=1 Tax=Eremothecium cymbalariae (strain CBS 270.75 / DBVPG 7215 / KCTC 17166 / NRRL Y-17582) TaxID=931890 RepID=G8JMR3_ERECY|nr:hypothetical protein Ecym_1504 [Eremothecium cymbalariae DBVPG\
MNRDHLLLNTYRSNSTSASSNVPYEHSATIKLPPLTNHHVQHPHDISPQNASTRTGMSSPIAPTPQFNAGTVAPQSVSAPQLLPSPQSRQQDTVVSNNNNYKLPKYVRTTWKPHEDVSLLHILIDSKHQLTDPQFISSPRRKFWQWISDQLYRESHISRNTRQCRDRFNLLYKKTSKRFAAQLPPRPHDELDKLLKVLLDSFDFNPEGNIILREQQVPSSSSSSSSATLNAPQSQDQYTQEQQNTLAPTFTAVTTTTSQQYPHGNIPISPMEEHLLQMLHNLTAEVGSLRKEVKQIKQLLSRKTFTDASPNISNW